MSEEEKDDDIEDDVYDEHALTVDLSGLAKEAMDDNSWDGKDDNVMINGVPLWLFLIENGMSRYELVQDNPVIVARLFHQKLKCFLKSIVLSESESEVSTNDHTNR